MKPERRRLKAGICAAGMDDQLKAMMLRMLGPKALGHNRQLRAPKRRCLWKTQARRSLIRSALPNCSRFRLVLVQELVLALDREASLHQVRRAGLARCRRRHRSPGDCRACSAG